MKKLISFILAVTMIAALFSGLVIFEASAEDEPFSDKGYIYTTLPGIQNWGESEMTVYNEQAAVKDSSASGTPGELVKTHLKGSATQAIKLTTNGSPNAWTIAFSTCGNASNRAAKSQIGNVLGDYSNLQTLSQFDGIRIAVQNESGNKPSFVTWDKTNSHIVCMRLLGSEANSWNNNAYPYMTNKQYEFVKEGDAADPIYATYYDGYYYFDFDLAASGWGGNFIEKYGSKNLTYGNMYFWLQTGGINSSNYNGGAIYISDMQLYKKPADPTVENLSKLVTSANALDVFGEDYEDICDADAIANNSASSRDDILTEILALSEIIGKYNDAAPAAKDRLNDLLGIAEKLSLFDDGSPCVNELMDADSVYTDALATPEQIYTQLRIVEEIIADNAFSGDLHDALINYYNTWKYNYTGASIEAIAAAVRHVWANFDDLDEGAEAAAINEAYSNLVPSSVVMSGENWFDNWTTDNVNEIITNNTDKLCDSIGEGLNRDGVYNNGDFTNNTTFTAQDGAFTMTANADFTDKSMGYKNMDRSGKCTGFSNDGYPVLNFTSIKDYTGIRFKVNVENGSVGRLLIGLSNCKDTTREMYAIRIDPEYADADGYINIPYSLFEAAFWCNPFTKDELDSAIVLIVEAYDVTNGTSLTLSDLEAYKATYVPENKLALLELINSVSSLDPTGRYANALVKANEVITNNKASDADIAAAEALLTEIIAHINSEDTDTEHYYDFVSMPVFTAWTEDDCITHNSCAANSEVALGTACIIGDISQSVSAKPVNGGFVVSNCEAGASAGSASKIGDPFAAYTESFENSTGIRFAITGKYGLPVKLPEDGSVTFTIYSTSSLPAYSVTYPAAQISESDYISFVFADMNEVSGTKAAVGPSFAGISSYETYKLFTLAVNGTDVAALNGGELCFSDVQLYTQHDVLPREELIELIEKIIELDNEHIFDNDIETAIEVRDNLRATQAQIDEQVDWLWEIYTALSDDFGNFDPRHIAATFGGVADTKVKKYDRQIKLLMIGNSFSWNAFTYIRQIAEAAKVDLVVANLYYGGCRLDQHWDFFTKNSAVYSYSSSWQGEKSNYTVTQALADQDWDYISIQQVSGLSGKYDDTYQPYLHNIVNYLRTNEPGAELIWHQTWAYQKTSDHSDFPKYDNDQDKMWAAIEYSSKKACEVEGIRYIVPSGKAFQNARATTIGDNLNTDGYHANEMGCYLAGYCFLSTVSGKLPDTNSYKLNGVSDADMKLLRKAITDAVNEYGYVAYDDSDPYAQALANFNKIAPTGLDGMMVAGNIADSSTADLGVFTSLNNDFVGNNNIMFTVGEQDIAISSKAPLLYSTLLAQFYTNDLEPASQKRVGNRHFVVNGVHVLSVGYDSVTDGFAKYTNSSLSWLDGELSAIDKEDSSLPVFVVTTYPVTHTAGSRGESRIADILRKHKRIFAFSGGTGASISDEATVLCDGFTAVNLGSLQNDPSESVLIDVDVNGNVRIRRFDLDGTSYDSIIINADGSNAMDYATGYYVAPTVDIANGSVFDLAETDAPVLTWLQDGEEATLNGEPCEYGATVSDPGEYTLVVTAGTKKTTVNFTVTESQVLTSIAVSALPGKLTYTQGIDTLDVTGGKLTLNYKNGSSDVIDITADMISGFDNSVLGAQRLTVTYEGFTATFDVTIENPLTSIEISAVPEKLTYTQNVDALDVTGGKLTLNYKNGSSDIIDITVDMISGFDNSVLGAQTLTVTYEGFTATFDITVEPGYTKGDFDNDGNISVTDALAALRIAAKLAPETEKDILIGDTDNDGHVTVTDALAILRVAAKLAETL